MYAIYGRFGEWCIRKENVAGDNGNESFKDEIDVIRYALDHVDQEIFVFRPSGELVYTNQPGKDRFHLPENLAGIYAWTLDPTLTLESWNKRIQPVRECGGELREYVVFKQARWGM